MFVFCCAHERAGRAPRARLAGSDAEHAALYRGRDEQTVPLDAEYVPEWHE